MTRMKSGWSMRTIRTCRQTLTFDGLIEFLKTERHIATFKLPERLEVVDQLPMTKVGKIDKKELRQIIKDKLQRK